MSSKRKIRRPTRRSYAVIRRQDADLVDDVVKTKTPHDVDIGRWHSPVSELGSGHMSNTVCTMAMFRWSKIYNNKPWALDWVGGLHRPGCGAVVFLSDDNGATWYCSGGVEKSESARNTYDGRSFRTIFITSVFDKDGTNWVKEDKKVGLDLRLFQGYGVKAFSMKAFDVRGDGTELRMLTAEQFLNRTNGYRVTGCLPVVESSLELTKPLVKFSSPADQLPGVVKEYREAFSRLPLDQQADCAFVPFVTSSRKSRQTPSAPVGKRKQLAACPAPPLPAASPSPLPTVRGGHDIAQCSSEATEYDDKNLYTRNAPRDSAQEGATALTERNEEEEDRGSSGPREDDGDDEYMDVGDENMQDQNMLGDDDVGTRGYFNVSAFDNTRENRAMMLSFEDVVHDMRQWCIDNHRIEAPKGKVGDKDAVAVAHKKKWQNFLRASMGKACDKAFVKQALKNEYSKDWRNKLRGYMNLARSTEAVWPLVEKFFEMFNEGKLSVGDGKIPLDMPGRMEGRQPGPYTDKTKGQRTLYHCKYARDGPKGSIVSWKDLCPSYFKNFGDLTCREREVALLLLMKGKVVATNVKVMPPRVNTECLLDIMRKERYMVRMFNYVVFRAEERADDEWNDVFFMSYKDLEDRYGPNGLCAAEWEKERDKLDVSKVKTVPRRLGGVEEARQGSGLGPTAAMYKEAPFHFKVFVYTSIDKLDLLRAEVKRVTSNARHIVWDKLKKQTTLLPVCMPLKEVLAAPYDIVAAAQKMTCRAVILDISPANFCTTWTSQEFDALHTMMTKCCGVNWVLFVFAPQKVQIDVLRCLFQWEDIELILGTWKRVDRPSNDITRYGNIATASRDMMAIVLHAEGGDLRKVTVAPRLVNDLTNVHVVEDKFGKCLGKHGGIEGDESVVYSIWEREPGKLRSLWGSFVGEKEGVFLLGRAHAGLVWEFLLAGNNVIAYDESAKDIAYLTKFIDILVKDDRFNCHVEKLRCKHRPNRDMFHKLEPKRLKVWEYLFRDMPQGRLDRKNIYRKAKATDTLKHYHGALTGAFETFVARCEILKFDLLKDQLTSKDYAELAKSSDGFNPVDGKEDSSDSDLELGEDTCAEVPRGGIVQAHDDGTVHSHEGSIPVAAPSVASMVAPLETAALQDNGRCGGNEEDDIEIPGEASTLAPGDAIPPGYCADLNTIYFLEGKHTHTGEDQWGHDIIWHEGVLQPCIQDGEWKMAVKYTSGWKTFRRMSKDIWLKTTELAILHRVRVEIPGQSEAAIKANAKELFHKVLDTLKGLLALLKFVDGDGPTISKIYGRIETLVGKLRESKMFAEVEKDELETIIMRRWNVMTSPLHCATMFLDHEYKVSKPEQDMEVAYGFWMWVYFWCKPAMYKEVDDHVNNWIEWRRQIQVGEGDARSWRDATCTMVEEMVQRVAPTPLANASNRLIDQGSSSSSCEWNWSLFKRIHSRPWNRHMLKKLMKKPKAREDEFLWEEDLDLEKKEVQAHANMRVEEWRSRLQEENRRRECDDEAEEDNSEVDDDETRLRRGKQWRRRINDAHEDPGQLERELNDSWQKSTKASKYLARLHLGELQEAAKTMNEAHVVEEGVAMEESCGANGNVVEGEY
ncbi:hypothetical protein CBR_g38651 [Chara braunii]|uniref:Uncharacterized protein n=1 Tax=Chara braunii TaxID=69332 RepID=A0A388K0P1_CHABU|nr:hypothetical protein CBR_g38651 [Chara braunii]|eukprot:GBG63585.1 hypothetical protein CBR_g38651 [Chara braunii]